MFFGGPLGTEDRILGQYVGWWQPASAQCDGGGHPRRLGEGHAEDEEEGEGGQRYPGATRASVFQEAVGTQGAGTEGAG